MKDLVTFAVIGAVAGGLFVTVFLGGDGIGGVVANAPTYKSDNASSTNYAIGPQLSTQVLAERSRRTYASICNDTSTDAYIIFADSAVTSTSSASVYLPNNTCYEIDRDNLYADIVHVLGTTATSSDLIVTEFAD